MNFRPSLGFICRLPLAVSTLALAGCASSPEGIQDMAGTQMSGHTRNQKRIEANAIQRAEHQAERRELEANW